MAVVNIVQTNAIFTVKCKLSIFFLILKNFFAYKNKRKLKTVTAD